MHPADVVIEGPLCRRMSSGVVAPHDDGSELGVITAPERVAPGELVEPLTRDAEEAGNGRREWRVGRHLSNLAESDDVVGRNLPWKSQTGLIC